MSQREREREKYTVYKNTWRAANDERDTDRRTGLTLTFPLGCLTMDSITHLNPTVLHS